MNLLKNLLFWASIPILLSSCLEEIELGAPGFEQQLVINGCLEADREFRIHLSENLHPAESPEIRFVTHAQIEIQSETESYPLHYSEDGFYVSTQKASPNKQYMIRITVAGFPEAEALTQVPSIPVIKTHRTKAPENEPVSISFTFSDPPDEENYYLVRVMAWDSVNNYLGNQQYENRLIYAPITFYSPHTFTELGIMQTDVWRLHSRDLSPTALTGDEGSLNDPVDGMAFSDELFNGTEVEITLSPYLYWARETQLTVFLYAMDKNQYLYLLSMADYLKASDDPFSEPTAVYNNIQGGLGLLCGQSAASFTSTYSGIY